MTAETSGSYSAACKLFEEQSKRQATWLLMLSLKSRAMQQMLSLKISPQIL